MSYPMRRIGRRKSDRFKIAAGMGIALVFFLLALQTRCGGSTEVSGPTNQAPVPSSQQAAASPAPAPTATPGLVGDDPKAFELTCLAGSTLTVKYNGPATLAKITTWSTDFDNQDPKNKHDLEWHDIGINGSVSRTFSACRQGDADQPGVKEIGGCFFDKDGKPFVPSRNPEKVTACRTVPCDPQAKDSWVEDEEYDDGEWSSCSANNQPPTTVAGDTQQCFKKKTRTWASSNICTKEKRYRTVWVYEECRCPCVYSEAAHTSAGFVEQDRDARAFWTDWWVVATASVQGAAEWKLEVYAASSVSEYNANDPDYTKVSQTKTLTCTEKDSFNAEYHSEDHGSDVWWAALYKNGTRVWKSQAEFN